MADELTLLINGMIYSGWEKISVESSIDHISSFDVQVSERWGNNDSPWQIQRFDAVTVAIDGAPVLTGFVDDYNPSIDKSQHTVRIVGRSKVMDLVDGMPDVPSNFNNQTLDAIANAIAAPFGITVIVQCDVGAAFPQAVIEKTETGHSFLEKLARMRSVLVTDDENGNLVLTQAGLGGAASTELIQGQNIERAQAKLSGQKMFQTYVVMSQTPLAFDGTAPQPDILGSATDPSCPRPRRFAEHSEHATDQAGAQARAQWRALVSNGKGTEATIIVPGFHQVPGGGLWKPNLTVPVDCSYLEISGTMLVVKRKFSLDDNGGRITELTIAPPSAYAPEPVDPNNGGDNIWAGAQKITGS